MTPSVRIGAIRHERPEVRSIERGNQLHDAGSNAAPRLGADRREDVDRLLGRR